MSFFGFDTSLPPLDKLELSKEEKNNVAQDLDTFGLKDNPILDDDEELNNETFGAAADVDKIDRNFDFTAGNSLFEKQMQGQNKGLADQTLKSSSSSIDKEKSYGIQNNNIKSASDMLNERIWNQYNANAGKNGYSDEVKNKENVNTPFDYNKFKNVSLSQIESQMRLENQMANFSPLQLQQNMQMANYLNSPKVAMDPNQMNQQQQQFQQLQQQLQQQQPAASLLKTNDPATNDQNNNIIAAMEKLNLVADPNAKPKDDATAQPAKAAADKTDGNNNQQNDKNNNRSNNSNNNYNNRNYNQNNRFQRNNRQNNYRRGMNQRGRRNWNNAKHISLPDSDFDFESANAKFKELSNKEADKNEKKEQAEDGNSQDGDVQDENGVEEKTQENFYNKSSSFFDNISCESKDRAEEQGKKFDRRAKQYEERKLNMETFGQATVNRGGHRGYRRNNYHSYRGRNYNRNGGYHRNNYRNYYNNNNNNRQKNNQDQQTSQNNNNTQQQQQQKQETSQ